MKMQVLLAGCTLFLFAQAVAGEKETVCSPAEQKTESAQQSEVQVETTSTETPKIYPVIHRPGLQKTLEMTSGLTAFIDPKTGELVQGTAEQSAKLAAAVAARQAPAAAVTPRVTKLANGMTRANVPASMMNFSIARIDEDGKLVKSCQRSRSTTLGGPGSLFAEESETVTTSNAETAKNEVTE